MGKGKETKNPDILSAGTHLAKKEKKSGKLKKIGITLLVIVIIAAVVGLNVYNYVIDTGFFARRTVAVSSENYSLTSSQMSYYFYAQYQNFYTMFSSYGMDISQYIDTTMSLKLQKCTFTSDGGTWFDYFMTSAVDAVSEQLALCEAAKAAGITLDDADYARVENTMGILESAAEAEGHSLKDYIKNMYGTYVTEKDIESAVELEVLANKYTEKCMNDVDTSDETLQAKYDETPDLYDTVDYLSYDFDYNDIIDADEAAAEGDETAETTAETEAESEEEEIDPAVKSAAAAEAKEYADRLVAEAADEESFKAVIRDYLINALHMTETEADEELEKAEYVVEDDTYLSTDDKIKWAFDAKVGDIKLFEETEEHDHDEEESEDAHDELGTVYTVLLLTSERSRDESVSYRDVRHILFTNETYEDNSKAYEVYNKWVADGASVEDFEALVDEYSEDTGSVSNGGLYEGVQKGEMVEGFENWLFDESRKEGDHGVVDSEYGWHIMYYEGGTIGWKAQITQTLEDEAYTAAVEAATETYSVNVDNDALDEISA